MPVLVVMLFIYFFTTVSMAVFVFVNISVFFSSVKVTFWVVSVHMLATYANVLRVYLEYYSVSTVVIVTVFVFNVSMFVTVEDRDVSFQTFSPLTYVKLE